MRTNRTHYTYTPTPQATTIASKKPSNTHHKPLVNGYIVSIAVILAAIFGDCVTGYAAGLLLIIWLCNKYKGN